VPFLGTAAREPRRFVYGARDRVDEVYDTARSVRDERWLYIRNYRPHLSWAPPEAYSDQSDFRRELLAQANAGKLGTGTTAWLAPTRAREELYDTKADPHQLVNLAANSEHAETLNQMRGALRAWLLEIRDTAFMMEDDSHARSGAGSPYEAARRENVYPFERVLAAAEAVGDRAAVAQQRAWLRDEDPAVRYWAALGFAANREGARQARAELGKAMTDSSPAVRIESAGALLGATGDSAARTVLLRELRRDDANVALQAARTLELLGDAAPDALETIRARHATGVSRENQSQLERYIGFSLGALLEATGKDGRR
jgi:uncharacterized sulfatase